MNTQNLEEKSEEVQEIIGTMPNWIIRWGITVFFGMIISLLFVAWVIKYPEVIASQITLTSPRPPANLITRSSGRLIFFEKNGKNVQKDQYVAAIENTSEIKDVQWLKKQLEVFTNSVTLQDSLYGFDTEKMLQLGELQADYSTFLQQYISYQTVFKSRYHSSKLEALQLQVQQYKQLNERLKNQKELTKRDMELAEKRYKADKVLHDGRLISDVELSSSESFYLQKKIAFENTMSNLISSNIQLTEIEKSLLDFSKQIEEMHITTFTNLRESAKRLQSQIDLWEQKYILKSPIHGRIELFKFWSESQFANAGEEIMTIIPDASGYLGKISLSQGGLGKVKVGQKVKIKFNDFPYNEFGTVEGIVKSLPLMSHTGQYNIDIEMPNGLQTSYGKNLEFRQDMKGNAEIITEDMRLIERMFYQLRKVLSNM